MFFFFIIIFSWEQSRLRLLICKILDMQKLPLSLKSSWERSWFARVVCQVAPASSPSCARWTPSTMRPPPAPRWRSGGRVSWPWRATRAATTSTTFRDSDAEPSLLSMDCCARAPFFPHLFIYLFIFFYPGWSLSRRRGRLQTLRSLCAFLLCFFFSVQLRVTLKLKGVTGKVSKQITKLLPWLFYSFSCIMSVVLMWLQHFVFPL